MFTGIVRSIGRIDRVDESQGGRRLHIAAPSLDVSFSEGDSLSVDGVCLTVESIADTSLTLFIATETEERTTLSDRDEGSLVNLEPAMAVQDRFDGHIVQGHVDGTAQIELIESVGEDWRFVFSIPRELDQYIVEKGSITIDGISLTVADRTDNTFSVAIIPTTYEDTTLHQRIEGDAVNLEVDIIAKYVESMLATRDLVSG